MSDIYRFLKPESDMLHPIPDAVVIDRVAFVGRLKGKKVLDIGSSGPMGEYLKLITTHTSVNKNNADYCLDIEKEDLPDGEFDYIFCGEILEHLSNAGMFLDKLAKYKCPIILTVPNAFGINRASKGVENVNKEHVAWYSYHTLSVLVERHGYMIHEFYWYNGKPYTAEGLIFVIGGRNGCP